MSSFYYWIIAKDGETGKVFLVAGGSNEAEARSKALECLPGVDWQIRRLPTRDMARASQIVRGKRLEETHSLTQARRRLGHDKSLNRLKSRIAAQHRYGGW